MTVATSRKGPGVRYYPALTQTAFKIAHSFGNFTERGAGIRMRKYQLEPAEAILDSVKNKRGMSFVVMISRQGGKDELSAHLKAFLVRLFSHLDVGIVEGNPTYKPQTINAIMRFENRLDANLLTRRRWRKRSDYIRRVGHAKVFFLSADKSANVVGATASLLLIVNEAQDVDPAVFDIRFAPMGASTNATRVYLGTAWTSKTLLARAIRECQADEAKDGKRRVFMYDADDVAKEIPAYGRHVKKEIARLGRKHPYIRTQYYNEEIDAEASLFGPERRALMVGDRPAHDVPVPGTGYVFQIDVAGQDEAVMDGGEDVLANPGRNATTLSVIAVDLSTLETLRLPTYRVVKRLSWIGDSHLKVFGQLKSLGESFRPLWWVVDVTGVGEGLWALISKHFGRSVELPSGKKFNTVIPVKFSAQVKSEIGWGFLGVIETGRFRDCCPSDIVDQQYLACQSEILTGPGKLMRWGVPDGTRDENGSFIFDDFVLADALCAKLDELEWSVYFETTVIEAGDVLEDMDRAY